MAAPRSTSLRALRTLSQQHPPSSFTPAEFRRNLHITGAQSARPANGPDRKALYLARSLADLKAECQNRSLGTSGNKAELVDRLSNHDILQTRAFSIAMRKIDRQAFAGGNGSADKQQQQQQQQQRTFNTSRANKTVKDSSTVDFAYIPTDFTNPDLPAYMTNHTLDTSPESQLRIPTPPDAYTHRPGMGASSASAPPMKPQIHFVGELGSEADAPSAMSEVVDNDAAEINPFELTEQVGRARRNAAASEQQGGHASVSSGEGEGREMVKELWGGLMDDVFGSSSKKGKS